MLGEHDDEKKPVKHRPLTGYDAQAVDERRALVLRYADLPLSGLPDMSDVWAADDDTVPDGVDPWEALAVLNATVKAAIAARDDAAARRARLISLLVDEAGPGSPPWIGKILGTSTARVQQLDTKGRQLRGIDDPRRKQQGGLKPTVTGTIAAAKRARKRASGQPDGADPDRSHPERGQEGNNTIPDGADPGR